MNTTPATKPKSYRLSFMINTVIGTLMLLLSAVGVIIEAIFPQMKGSLAWRFMFAAVPSLFIASLHYSKYLVLSK